MDKKKSPQKTEDPAPYKFSYIEARVKQSSFQVQQELQTKFAAFESRLNEQLKKATGRLEEESTSCLDSVRHEVANISVKLQKLQRDAEKLAESSEPTPSISEQELENRLQQMQAKAKAFRHKFSEEFQKQVADLEGSVNTQAEERVLNLRKKFSGEMAELHSKLEALREESEQSEDKLQEEISGRVEELEVKLEKAQDMAKMIDSLDAKMSTLEAAFEGIETRHENDTAALNQEIHVILDKIQEQMQEKVSDIRGRTEQISLLQSKVEDAMAVLQRVVEDKQDYFNQELERLKEEQVQELSQMRQKLEGVSQNRNEELADEMDRKMATAWEKFQTLDTQLKAIETQATTFQEKLEALQNKGDARLQDVEGKLGDIRKEIQFEQRRMEGLLKQFQSSLEQGAQTLSLKLDKAKDHQEAYLEGLWQKFESRLEGAQEKFKEMEAFLNSAEASYTEAFDSKLEKASQGFQAQTEEFVAKLEAFDERLRAFSAPHEEMKEGLENLREKTEKVRLTHREAIFTLYQKIEKDILALKSRQKDKESQASESFEKLEEVLTQKENFLSRQLEELKKRQGSGNKNLEIQLKVLRARVEQLRSGRRQDLAELSKKLRQQVAAMDADRQSERSEIEHSFARLYEEFGQKFETLTLGLEAQGNERLEQTSQKFQSMEAVISETQRRLADLKETSDVSLSARDQKISELHEALRKEALQSQERLKAVQDEAQQLLQDVQTVLEEKIEFLGADFQEAREDQAQQIFDLHKDLQEQASNVTQKFEALDSVLKKSETSQREYLERKIEELTKQIEGTEANRRRGAEVLRQRLEEELKAVEHRIENGRLEIQRVLMLFRSNLQEKVDSQALSTTEKLEALSAAIEQAEASQKEILSREISHLNQQLEDSEDIQERKNKTLRQDFEMEIRKIQDQAKEESQKNEDNFSVLGEGVELLRKSFQDSEALQASALSNLREDLEGQLEKTRQRIEVNQDYRSRELNQWIEKQVAELESMANEIHGQVKQAIEASKPSVNKIEALEERVENLATDLKVTRMQLQESRSGFENQFWKHLDEKWKKALAAWQAQGSKVLSLKVSHYKRQFLSRWIFGISFLGILLGFGFVATYLSLSHQAQVGLSEGISKKLSSPMVESTILEAAQEQVPRAVNEMIKPLAVRMQEAIATQSALFHENLTKIQEHYNKEYAKVGEEVTALTQQNDTMEFENLAIGEGSREAYEELRKMATKAYRKETREAATAGLRRIQMFHQVSDSVAGVVIPYTGESGKSYTNATVPPSALMNLLKVSTDWKVRAKAAELLGNWEGLGISRALAGAIAEDPRLEVVQKALVSFSKLTKYPTTDLSGARGAQTWLEKVELLNNPF